MELSSNFFFCNRKLAVMQSLLFLLILMSAPTLSTATNNTVVIECPYNKSITWDYVDLATLRFSYTNKLLAQFCILCQDYYPTKEKDASKFNCIEVRLIPEEVETLKLLGPGTDRVAGVYMFHCIGEGIKERLSTEELVKGDLCDSYHTGTNRVTIIQDDQAFNETITNLHQEPNWEETSRQWRKQWIISCTFNILFSICILLVLLVLYYKRKLGKLSQAVLKPSKTIVENAMMRFNSKNEEEDGVYEAQDIDFRTARLMTSSTTSNGQIMARDVNVAIESIDVVTYCTPKDILITDQSKNTYQEP